MAETMKIDGDSGTPANVAYKLLVVLMSVERFENRQQILDVYAECLHAAHGARSDWKDRARR